jgi:hypothetical protein
MIPNGQLLHTYHETHKLFTLLIHDFITLPIKNWKYNRSPDKIRCKEIAAHIIRAKQPVETVFYLTKTDKGYEILDGIHRYTALKMISEEPVDYITQNTDWLFASMVLVNVRFAATNGELIDFFQSLNKANPVPELYMRDPDEVRRETVEAIVKRWQTRYPDHFSASRKPVRPNMNRDAFVEVIDGLIEKFMVDDMIDVDRMERALEHLNTTVQEEWAARETPRTAIEKCRRTGFWLFLLGADAIVERV